MKRALIGMLSIVVVLLFFILWYTIYGRNVRQTELDAALESSMEKALSMLSADRESTPKTEEEWEAMFLETLLLQIDSKSELTVHIIDADMEKGLLSVEAILTFKHPIGTKGSVSSQRTAIVEQYYDSETVISYTVQFVVSGESYLVYSLPEGSSYIVPTPPQKDGYVFKGWKNAATGEIEDISQKLVDENATYHAVFE